MTLRNPGDTVPIFPFQGQQNRATSTGTIPRQPLNIWRLINWKVVIPVSVAAIGVIFTTIAILLVDSALSSSEPSDKVVEGPEPRVIEELQIPPREYTSLRQLTNKEVVAEKIEDHLPMPREVVFVVVEKPVEIIVQPKVEKQVKDQCDNSKLATKIDFLPLPTDAFQKAKERNKIVFVMHLAGNFEDGAFT
jgi:hypothetical protein